MLQTFFAVVPLLILISRSQSTFVQYKIWQATFRAMIAAFETSKPNFKLPTGLLNEDTTIRNILNSTQLLVKVQGDFKTFLSTMAKADDTWKFWA